MAARRIDKAPTGAPPGESEARPAIDPASMGLTKLAEAVLSRKVRPRVADVRRLAEAVLAAKAKKKKRKGSEKKSADKKRKLSRIPGQESRK